MGCYVLHGKTIKQWSEETGLHVRLIQRRLRDHYDIKMILAPKKLNQVKRGSIKHIVDEIVERDGITKGAAYQRINRARKKKQ